MATLLIVEDEDVLARSLVRAFTQQGYDVHHASTLAAADRAVAQASPDVVLLDLRLPDGSGLEWLATIPEGQPYFLYLHYIDDHVTRLDALGRLDLARAFERWRTRLVG